MRVVVFVKSDESTEAGSLPTEESLARMGKFNEELVEAGVMLAGEGLHPTSAGRRVRLSHGGATVTGGRAAKARDVVAGFWMWKVDSIEEAVDWVKRIPNADGTFDGEYEIRPVMEADDFGEAFTPELREQEERLREKTEATLSR